MTGTPGINVAVPPSGTDWAGPALAPPTHHPLSQPVPDPVGRVPPDWQLRLH
jgi:hypothetical protein